MDLEDGPRRRHVGPADGNLHVGEPFQQGRIDQVLAVGSRDDGNPGPIGEAVQLGQQGGQELIAVLAHGTASDPANGLDLIQEQDREAVQGRLPEGLETLPDVLLSDTHVGIFPFCRLDHGEPAAFAAECGNVIGRHPRHEGLAAPGRADHQDRLSATQSVSSRLIRSHQGGGEGSQQSLQVGLLTANLVRTDVGDLVEQESAGRRPADQSSHRQCQQSCSSGPGLRSAIRAAATDQRRERSLPRRGI